MTAGSIKGESYSTIVWRQFKKNRFALVSLCLIAPLYLIAVFAPLIASDRPFVFFDGNLAALDDGSYLVDLEMLEEEMPGQAEPNRSITLVVRPQPGTKLESAGESANLVLALPDGERTHTLKREHSKRAEAVNQPRFVSQDSDLFITLQQRQEDSCLLSVELNGETVKGEFGRWLYPWIRDLFITEESVDFLFNMAFVAFFPWMAVAILVNLIARKRGMGGGGRLIIAVVQYAAIVVVACVMFADITNKWLAENELPVLRPNDTYKERSFAKDEFQLPQRRFGWYTPIPFGPTQQDTKSSLEPPGYRKPFTTELQTESGTIEKNAWEKATDGFVHILGTDDLGQDVLVRLIYGTRISMTVGFLAVSLYITIGVVVGAIAGYFGGVVDILICRIIEVVLLFPSFFLILTLVAMIGPSIYIIMVVIGITGWPTVARLTRGEFLKQRAIEYTSAARVLGASHPRVIFGHILPNALSPALVAAPFGIAGAIITEAGLSLLGFGVRAPAPSWGTILKAGNDYFLWWLIVFPSLAIFFTVTVFNLVGSGLRDAMDPRLRK